MRRQDYISRRMRSFTFRIPAAFALATFISLSPVGIGGARASPCDPAAVFASGFHAHRTQAVCEFKSAMLGGYALIYQKEKRIRNADGTPFRSGRHLENCVLREYAIADDETPESHVAWLDRMRECGAAFQDSHLDLQSNEYQPYVSLGISLREAQGRFYIDRVYPALLSDSRQLSADERALLKPGTEITALDGQSIDSAMKALEPRIPASSTAYRRFETLDRLTERNHSFPISSSATLTVSQGRNLRTLALTWAADLAGNKDKLSVAALEARGFKDAPFLPWRSDFPSTDLPSEIGYSDQDAAVPESALDRLESYRGADDYGPALRFVKVDAKRDSVEKSYCYLQLASFAEDRVRGEKGWKKDYSQPMRKFLRQCGRKKLPLVLDLRTNPGGYINLGSQTLAALTPRKERSPVRGTWAYRDSTTFREIQDGYFDGQYWGNNSLEITAREKWDPRSGGYGGKVIALITPNCMSSCDRLASMLKTAGRATLLGSSTNGTGAGFMDTLNPNTGKPASEWTDTRGLLWAQIPDQLFGAVASEEVPLTSGKPKGLLPWFKWVLAGKPEATEYLPLEACESWTLIENLPTQPDIRFEPAAADLPLGQESWIRAIQSNLDAS